MAQWGRSLIIVLAFVSLAGVLLRETGKVALDHQPNARVHGMRLSSKPLHSHEDHRSHMHHDHDHHEHRHGHNEPTSEYNEYGIPVLTAAEHARRRAQAGDDLPECGTPDPPLQNTPQKFSIWTLLGKVLRSLLCNIFGTCSGGGGSGGGGSGGGSGGGGSGGGGSGGKTLTVPTYFWVIDDGTVHISDSRLQDQITLLNSRYSSIGYQFDVKKITRVTNNAWYSYTDAGGSDEQAMKAALRQGDAQTLNVYFNQATGAYCGYTYFPSNYGSNPKMDGVVINDICTPGGPSAGKQGITLVHEIGHWFGLYHTFQGGCNDGDMVADTPAEDSPTSGCPSSRDSCPALGLDPIHNYMDYSSDDCRIQFTAGQISRMQVQYAQYRAGH